MSGNSSVFSSLRPTSGAQLRSAGGQSHDVTGVGDVDIQVLTGEIKTVSSVLYTPGITKNLLSVGSLTDQQKTLVFRSIGCFVIDNATMTIEAFAHRENTKGLYRLQTDSSNPKPEAHSLRLRSQAVLWHRRLGHFHARGMKRMIVSEAVKGLPHFQIPTHTCSGCQLGKHARTKVPKETSFHASKILELVHSDVCGPFKICSTGGARYFATFIDDFSKKTWIYFIAQKSQVLEKFQHFVQSVQNLTGQTVRALRTDNGGEYTSKAFSDFCSFKGITRELTPPYTPQRNGVAERRNRSLLDITRCLLLDKALPGHLWGEAVKAAGDILNLRSTKKHPDMTPNELFFGKKPSIAHLCIFGSPVFAHVPKTKRSKLDPRSEKCVLLSFDETAKAYRCYRPSTRKIFISRDVFIDEDSLLEPDQTNQTSACDRPQQTDFISAPTRREESHNVSSTQAQPCHQVLFDQPPTNPCHDPVSSDVPDDTSQSLDDAVAPQQVTEQLAPTNLSPLPTDNPPRRSDRIRRFPRHLQDFAAHIELDSPASLSELQSELTFQQVHNNPLWQAAMQAEIDSIHSNNTWTLVELPPHKKAISSKWVYKVKTSTNGAPPRYKARLVARGFEQKDGTDFLDTFAPVVRWETIRTLIAIAIHLN